MNIAAGLLALGVDPTEFLNTKDEVTRAMWIRLGELTTEYKYKLDEILAARIANAVGKLFKR